MYIADNGVIFSDFLPSKPDVNMPPLFITHEIVRKIIASLNSQGVPGPDRLPGAFYKNTVDVIVAPLAIIYNLSLQTGVIPDIWKKASITPVFKKGSPSDPSNYRPISITCIACRLLVYY